MREKSMRATSKSKTEAAAAMKRAERLGAFAWRRTDMVAVDRVEERVKKGPEMSPRAGGADDTGGSAANPTTYFNSVNSDKLST